MSGSSTNVPAPVFGAAGWTLPQESAILTGAFADINAAFGGYLNPALSSPQGQLASSLAAIIGDKNDQLLALFNGVDPAYATGRMQDAIGRLYFLARLPAQPSTVVATCMGAQGRVIPVGARAQDGAGNLWACTEGGTIPATGSIGLTFACEVVGPVTLAAGALATIYGTLPGWDTITNATAAVVGVDVETPQAFERRRRESVNINGSNVTTAIRAAVLQLPGVLDCFAYDNASGGPVTVNGVTIPANALYVCVAGGVASDIALAIWSKKPPGCAYAGATTQTVLDSSSGYTVPFPSYEVSYQTATALPFYVSVAIANNPDVPSNALALVQAAVVAAFSGGDGGMPASKIGGTVYASRFYAGVAALGAWAANIVSIAVGTSAGPTATQQTVAANAIAAISAGQITLTLI